MIRFAQMVGCVTLGAFLALMIAASPQADWGPSGEVIDITKAEWKAIMDKNPSGALRNVAEECTQFRPGFPTRFEGKDMIRRWADAQTSGTGNLILAEMTNEKIQTFGNTAILSYNFSGMMQDADGNAEPLIAKSTRVYVKERGQWWLVHANFAPVGVE